jgi:3-hydroxyacyl-CoA dehydrogenase
MSDIVKLQHRGEIALITVDNPPVNALSASVRSALADAFSELARSSARAAVLACEGRTFFAGADISEFGKPPADPWLPEVLNVIESSEVPVIAAIHGTALGGGLETAMACHYRIAAPGARLGLPEVLLGLLPGAGGTQWAPRLIGIEAALELMISGKPVAAPAALEMGLVDRLADGELVASALAWAKELIEAGEGPRRSSGLPVESSHLPPGFFDAVRSDVARRTKGLPAPQRIIDCVEAASRMPFEAAVVLESELFMELMMSPESAALRHIFFAEREAAKIDDLPKGTARRPVESAGIIGAGTMGGGIAMSFANAGIPVVLLEIDQASLDRGLAACRGNYERSVARGRFTREQVEGFMGRIRGTTDYADLADVDLVIEAVFENPEIKFEVFRRLDEVCKPGAILASNTSYQDIDLIADATARPADVLGMHFFSPANVMKLLEVVRGEKTADDVLATVMSLARKIRKVPVMARVCYGFIGNRMLEGYFREAQLQGTAGAAGSTRSSIHARRGPARGDGAPRPEKRIRLLCLRS